MRLPRTARALVAAAGLAAVAAGPAAAAPGDPLALNGPAAGARLAAGANPRLRARSVADDSGLELRVSRIQSAIDACGRINADVARAPGSPVADDPSLYDFPTARWFDTPGTYFWQVIRTGADGSCTATAARRIVLTGALPTRPELAGLARQRIPGNIGRRTARRTGSAPAASRPA